MDEQTEKSVSDIRTLARSIARSVQIMEVCGTHTVSIFRNGLRALLPDNVRLISGPGCPVCVTAQRHIDASIELSSLEDVIVATYGDMVRVPGRLGNLERQRGVGADVRVVNSARAAVRLARENPTKQVVFISVGFETTAPASAAVILEAEDLAIQNLTMLTAHKLVIPAMLALLADGEVPVDGFLCPGHVSVIIGSDAYRPIVEDHHIPCVVAGFEPRGILAGLAMLLRQIADADARVENAYETAVTPQGNEVAQRLMKKVFAVSNVPWRALGVIPQSGLDLAPAYRHFDALVRFAIELGEDLDHPQCRCGEVIQGKVNPNECHLFGTTCAPTTPIGPCMVSSEGTCSAWFKYNRPSQATRATGTEVKK
ncbi:MAG: hydrogenase formation protein HypD [Phycisphaerales bacterium]|nr:MAG: hydrogenase formation protein HypD [Phycisphaerales bacterium]